MNDNRKLTLACFMLLFSEFSCYFIKLTSLSSSISRGYVVSSIQPKKRIKSFEKVKYNGNGYNNFQSSLSSILSPTTITCLYSSINCNSNSIDINDGIASNNMEVDDVEKDEEIVGKEEVNRLHRKLDKDFLTVAFPAFIGLAAEPLMAFIDSMYVGRLGAVEQAGMGIAISAQYSIAKLYNDPLLKTSTSLVAGKSGEELSASVATAISTAMVIGIVQCLLYVFCANPIISFMGVSATSPMRGPAIAYMRWRAVGVPAATILLVSNGIFRGRGDTKTPLYCTSIGNLVNIILDPILILSCGMGASGAGAAQAVSQWITAIPLIYLLNKSIPFNILQKTSAVGSGSGSNNPLNLQEAVKTYFQAGGLILLRTIAKISAYTVTSAAAARLGTVPMAAYSLLFSLGFASTQLCESLSIAAQALLARDMPLTTPKKRIAAAHVINRALLGGLLVSGSLTLTTLLNQEKVLMQMTTSVEVRAAAAAVMPIVLVAQMFKGLTSSTGGILLGGLDWVWSTASMSIAAILCIFLTKFRSNTLADIWIALAVFMITQLSVASVRIFSGKGPWTNLKFKKLFV